MSVSTTGAARKTSARLLVLTTMVFAAGLVLAPSAFAHNPEITASVNCAGLVTFTSTAWAGEADDPNTAQNETALSRTNASVQISYSTNGAGGPFTALTQKPEYRYDPTNGFSFSDSFQLASPLPASAVVKATTLANWANGVNGGQSAQTGVLTLPTCPSVPSAQVADVDCATGGAAITFTNGGGGTVTFVVAKTGSAAPLDTVQVGPKGTATKTYPVGEGESATFTVTAPGMTDVVRTVARDCAGGQATVVEDCDSGGALVTVTNEASSLSALPFTISKDGQVLETFDVQPGQSVERFYPMAEGEFATFVITAPGMSQVQEVIQFHCESPNPKASFDIACARGGVMVTLRNTGDAPASFSVRKNGGQIDSLTVAPGGSKSILVPMEEDESAGISVFTLDAQTGGFVVNEHFTFDCDDTLGGGEERPPSEPPTEPPGDDVGAGREESPEVGGSVLPFSGSSTTSLLIVALTLMVAGAAALLVSRSVALLESDTVSDPVVPATSDHTRFHLVIPSGSRNTNHGWRIARRKVRGSANTLRLLDYRLGWSPVWSIALRSRLSLTLK